MHNWCMWTHPFFSIQLPLSRVFDVLTDTVASTYISMSVLRQFTWCLLVCAQWFRLCGEQRSDFGVGSLELAVVTLSRADLSAALHECVFFFQEPVNSLMQYAHEGKCGAALLLAPFQCTYVHTYIHTLYILVCTVYTYCMPYGYICHSLYIRTYLVLMEFMYCISCRSLPPIFYNSQCAFCYLEPCSVPPHACRLPVVQARRAADSSAAVCMYSGGEWRRTIWSAYVLPAKPLWPWYVCGDSRHCMFHNPVCAAYASMELVTCLSYYCTYW